MENKRTCSVCGMEIWDHSPYFPDAYGCDRCGKSDVCNGCIHDVSMDGYWMEVWSDHSKICNDCYEELREEFRSRWESEFGYERERGLENPY